MSVATAAVAGTGRETSHKTLVSQLEQVIGQRNDLILSEIRHLTSKGRSKIAINGLCSEAESILDQSVDALTAALEETKCQEDLTAVNAQVVNAEDALAMASKTVQDLLKKDDSDFELDPKSSKLISKCSSVLEDARKSLFQISEPEIDEPTMTLFLSVTEQESGLVLGFDSEIDANDLSPYTQLTIKSVNRILNRILDLEIAAIVEGDDNGLVAKFGKITTIEDLIDVIQTFVVSFSEMISFYPGLSKAVLSECSSIFNHRLCRECVPQMYPKTADAFEDFKKNLEGLKGLDEVMNHFGWEDHHLLTELVSEFSSTWQFFVSPTERLVAMRDFLINEPYQPYQPREVSVQPQSLSQSQIQNGTDQHQAAVESSRDPYNTDHPITHVDSLQEQQIINEAPEQSMSTPRKKQNLDLESDVEDGWGWGDSNGEGFLSDVESSIGGKGASDEELDNNDDDDDDAFQKEFEDYMADETLVDLPADREAAVTPDSSEAPTSPQKRNVQEDREATVLPSERIRKSDIYDDDAPPSSLGQVISIFREAEASGEILLALSTLYKALSKTHYASAFPLALYRDTALLCKSISDLHARDDLLSFANGVFSEAAFAIQCEQERLIAKLSEDVESPDLAEITNAIKQQILQVARHLSSTDDRRLAILQSLTEQACCCFINAVLEQQDISEQAALTLHSCIGLLAELERLFVSISNTVPSWIKLQRLASLLIANLDEIRDMVLSSTLLDYSDAEVEHIIRALFVDSARRSQVLALIAHE